MNLPEFFPQQPGIELQSKEEISHEYRSFFPPPSLAGRPPEKLAPSARPPTYQESLKSLPFFFLQSQDGRYGKQSIRRAPQR